jgi:hypothetical protein
MGVPLSPLLLPGVVVEMLESRSATVGCFVRITLCSMMDLIPSMLPFSGLLATDRRLP